MYETKKVLSLRSTKREIVLTKFVNAIQHIVGYCLKTSHFKDYKIVFMEIFLHENVLRRLIIHRIEQQISST